MDFNKRFKIMSCISAAILLAGILVGLFAGGLNLGVDFTGGTLFTMDLHGEYDMAVLERALLENGVTGAQVQRTGASGTSQTMADIRMQSSNDDAAESALRVAILDSVRKTYPEAEITAVDRVDGVASATLIRNAFFSVLIAGALILVYIWIRFELLFGVAAVVALVHDVAIMLALTAILRIPVNSPFIAAVLTIVGYSINNTIVIFDRIRENSRNDVYIHKHREEVVNASIRGTVTRSINTSITTLLTVLMVYILGIESIRQFTLPIIIGLMAGTYSSIFLAGPMWAKFHAMRARREKENAAQTKEK